jgi:hypothetical protein
VHQFTYFLIRAENDLQVPEYELNNIEKRKKKKEKRRRRRRATRLLMAAE